MLVLLRNHCLSNPANFTKAPSANQHVSFAETMKLIGTVRMNIHELGMTKYNSYANGLCLKWHRTKTGKANAFKTHSDYCIQQHTSI